MRTIFIALFILGLSLNMPAQEDLNAIAAMIENEGKMLYYSEKASWHGTDIFLEKMDRNSTGGYFSYPYLDSVRCIFFSKNAIDRKVIFTATFDKEFDLSKVNVDTNERTLALDEQAILKMREQAIQRMQTDTIFKHYKNANLNVIPIINGSVKRVYVLTGPSVSGVVLFGNDYLLEFEAKNEITSVKKLHKSLISFEHSTERLSIGTMHTHLPEMGEFITPTDICTLMLYQKQAGWNVHYVISENYISTWNCITNSLSIMSNEDFNEKSEQNDDSE